MADYMVSAEKLPEPRFVYVWGTLEPRFGVTQSMVQRACMLVHDGHKVDVLLGGRGKGQLKARSWWKELGYHEIDKVNFLTMEDYFATRFTRIIQKQSLPEGETFSYGGHVRMVRSAPVATEGVEEESTYTEYYVADTGYPYLEIGYLKRPDALVEQSIVLRNQYSGSERRFRDMSELRSFFFSDYINGQGESVLVAFNDAPGVLNPGFEKVYRAGKLFAEVNFFHQQCVTRKPNGKAIINDKLRRVIDDADESLRVIVVGDDDQKKGLEEASRLPQNVIVASISESSMSELQELSDGDYPDDESRGLRLREWVVGQYQSSYSEEWNGVLKQILASRG